MQSYCILTKQANISQPKYQFLYKNFGLEVKYYKKLRIETTNLRYGINP